MDSNIEKVYIIVKGEYSDFHICAVALDEKTAEKLREAYSDRYDKAIIEEYIPAKESEETRILYEVEFEHGGVFITTAEREDNETLMDINNDFTWLILRVFAKDKEHALKIAQDRRAEYLAMKEGVL